MAAIVVAAVGQIKMTFQGEARKCVRCFQGHAYIYCWVILVNIEHDEFVKSNISPPLAGGEEGEGEK
jgi:hypothetical protein